MANTRTSRSQISTAAESSSEATINSRRGAGGNTREHRLSKQDHKGNPSKEPEGQQEQSNMEESLLDGKDNRLIEIDDEYNFEAGSGVPLDREEQKDRDHFTSRHGGHNRTRGDRDRDRDRRPTSSYHGKLRGPPDIKLHDITKLYKEQAAKLLEAEGTIREKDEQINALTENISRLHLRGGGIARDDSYFTTQFSVITNSITQWTVTNFPKSQRETISDVNGLPVELIEIVNNTVLDSRKILRSTGSRRHLVNAMVINFICPFLFGPFILGAPEASNTILAVGPLLQGTDYQIQRWRALTVNMLAQGPDYERRYNEEVSSAVQRLGNMLTPLAPMEFDANSRNTGLYKIVESVAALSIEIRKQTDVIYPVPVQPGAIFKADIMEDLNCEYELEELDGKAVVQVPTFPAIMRRSYRLGGEYDEPYNLMKAKVTTMFIDE